MNIVIPCAGSGRRMKEAGYTDPKPLIKVFDKMLIEYVIKNVAIDFANFIFLFQKIDIEKYNLKQIIPDLVRKYCQEPQVNIVEVDGITQGSVSTVLLSEKYVNNYNPVILANSDQYIENLNIQSFLKHAFINMVQASTITFNNTNPKWSFVKPDENFKRRFLISGCKEKVQGYSSEANVGIYYYSSINEMFEYFKKIVEKNIKINSEFYTSSAFDLYIQDGLLVNYYPLQKSEHFFGLGTPEDLNYFKENYGK